jgi:hypothetical protein
MYALLRCAHARKQHVCPAGDTIQRGAYITTKGVVTYAPPAGRAADRKGGGPRYPAHRVFKRQHGPTEEVKAMTTRKITTMAFIAGIVIGAAATEGFNVYRQSHDSQIFQERLRCKAVADAYVKENSTDKNSTEPRGVFLTLDNVDYSPARNSCVAELETVSYYRGGVLTIENVEDLLSGEILFAINCTEECEMLRAMFLDRAFDYVMKNASKPHDKYLVELEKGRRTSSIYSDR